jgi:ubiquinone/menaquinone biosynthesis C-methylase UbiE
MENAIKEIVKEKYAEIARQDEKCDCFCGCGPQIIDLNMIGDDYAKVDGHFDEADLGLGCGIPTEYAGIKPGDTVLDLGSGAGNDVFIASKEVGEAGRVIGVDMTQDMIDRANRNMKKGNYSNVEFRLGEIEALPVADNSVDVVISNCVLNLVPDKRKAFSEIFRALKPGGRFCISDVVLKGILPEGLQRSAEMYAGCVAGATQMEEYLGIVNEAGFENVEVVKSKSIDISRETLERFLTAEELATFDATSVGIFSITVKAEKMAV